MGTLQLSSRPPCAWLPSFSPPSSRSENSTGKNCVKSASSPLHDPASQSKQQRLDCSTPAVAMAASSSAPLAVDLHVKYIQSLDTVRSQLSLCLTKMLTGCLRIYLSLPSPLAFGYP